MPQYQVPQFIDMPDKVFGPLTIRQFILLAIGMAPIIVIYNFFQGWVLIVFGIPIFVFTLAIVFYKHNGIPLPTVVMNFIKFAFAQKLYIWQKRASEGSTLPKLEDLPQLEKQPSNNPAMLRVMPQSPTSPLPTEHRTLNDLSFVMNAHTGKQVDDTE